MVDCESLLAATITAWCARTYAQILFGLWDAYFISRHEILQVPSATVVQAREIL